jgi:hypothetical protein
MPVSRESAQKAPTGGRFLPQRPLWRKHAAGREGPNWPKISASRDLRATPADPVPVMLKTARIVILARSIGDCARRVKHNMSGQYRGWNAGRQ